MVIVSVTIPGPELNVNYRIVSLDRRINRGNVSVIMVVPWKMEYVPSNVSTEYLIIVPVNVSAKKIGPRLV
jgi:hypothetical protein